MQFVYQLSRGFMRAVHMFPTELATGLCSLNPGVDRLVQSCLMEVDRAGCVVRYELHDGIIRTAARMTAFNPGASPPPVRMPSLRSSVMPAF